MASRSLARRIVGFLLAGIATAAYATEAETVVAAWGGAISAAQAMTDYEMRGTTASAAFLGPDEVVQETTWSVVRSGKRYRCEWADPTGSAHVQTFNGDLWYGMTTHADDAGESAVVVGDPTRSLETDFELDLQKAAQGVFHLSLEDFLRKPFNLGGTDLYESFAALPVGTTGTIDSQAMALFFADPARHPASLPKVIEFRISDSGAVPSMIVVEQPSSGGVHRHTWMVEEFETFDGELVPTRTLSRLQEISGSGQSRLLQEVAVSMAWKKVQPSDAMFAVDFPETADVFDDRKPAAERLQRGNHPGQALDPMLVWLICSSALLVLGIVFVALKQLRRRAGL